MCIINIMKKNILGKILNNPIVYYIVVVFAFFNVLGYFSMRSWECVVLFGTTAALVQCYSGKNTYMNNTISLLAGLFMANFVFGCNRIKENFQERFKPLKKAKKLVEDAEEDALQGGMKAEEDAAEGFATLEGNENMGNAIKMLGALSKGKEGLGEAVDIEKVVKKMGGFKGIMQAFGSMNK